MGRKYKNQRQKQQKQNNEGSILKKIKTTEIDEYHNKPTNLVKRNVFYEEFYKIILKDDLKDDFEQFKQILTQKLPVTFRVNQTAPNYQQFVKLLKNKDLIQDLDSQILSADQSRKKENTPQGIQQIIKDSLLFEQLQFKQIDWLPKELSWQINVDKQIFKKSKVFDQIHKFIQKSSDSGLITRQVGQFITQELVSMIPAVLLDLKQSDIVLDMCAAPGSKTSQMMEIQGNMATGGIVANDADLQRAEMLIHQVQRINSQGILVVNHYGQFIPSLASNGQKFQFDKVLADVPCTGDGAIRKIPSKWEKWHTNDALGIHSLQIQLLLRAISIAKVGGLILYSTCSINPIEDEAVITEVFRRCNYEALELVDLHHKLPGLKARRGLTHWPVLQLLPDVLNSHQKHQDFTGKEPFTVSFHLFQIYQNYEDYLEKRHIYQKHIVNKGMFADDYDKMFNKLKIQNTMRILPQDQNTGGFYLALIRKNAEIHLIKQESTNDETIDNYDMQNIKVQQEDVEKIILKEKQQLTQKRENKQTAVLEEIMEDKKVKKNVKQSSFKIIDQDDFKKIRSFYGLNSKCRREQFIQNIGGDKKILVVSESIAQFLEHDTKNQLNLVNMGAKAFTKNKQNYGGEDLGCQYRICQDACLVMSQYLDKQVQQDFRRKVQISFKQLVQILSKEKHLYNEFDLCFQEKMNYEGQGALILFMDEELNEQRIQEAVVVNNFKDKFSLMISKELIESYRFRYLSFQ